MGKRLYIDDIIHFFGPLHKVKTRERSGWKERGVERAETIGAHGFGAAHLAWLLANAEGADAGKAMKMSLANDLQRASLPDLTPTSMAYFRQSEFEESAFEELAKYLPALVRKEYQTLLEEFRKGESLEAKIAREASKLDTILQAIAYERETGKRFAASFFATYSGDFETETGKELYSQLRQRARRGFRLKKVYDVRIEEAERAAAEPK